jgi:isoquinoline 1-oxidoreductase beta subunit
MTKQMKIETIETQALSRRSFLVGTGAASVGVAFGPLASRAFAAAAPYQAGAWVTIGADNSITVVSPASEMGQGSMTSVPVLIAEELDADWRRVRFASADDNQPKVYGNPVWGDTLTTYGSGTIRGYYLKARIAGAQARKILLWNASQKWKVPVTELSTEPNMVVHKASGRKISYGELAKTAKLPDPLPQATKDDLKPASRFRLIGKDLGRAEVPSKVNGKAKFGIDTMLPNMLYASILFPPVQGEKPAEINDAAAKSVKGVVKVVKVARAWGTGEGVAVIGETPWATMKAKKALKVTWTKEAKARGYDSAKAHEEYLAVARDMSNAGVTLLKKGGDASAAIAGAAKTITVEVTSDHVSHVPMEPINATAVINGDKCEIWSSNQSPTSLKAICAKTLGTKPESVTIHSTFLGGGFGRRSEGDDAALAALLAKEVPGRPVKLIWSREDDVTNDLFRPLAAQRIDVGLDAQNNIVGWRHRVVSESFFARSNPFLFNNVFKGKDLVASAGADDQYHVPAYEAQYVRVERGVAVGPWRGIGDGYTKLAIESAIDQLAKLKGQDPVAYRVALLHDEPRAVKVIEQAAKMAKWGSKRPNGRALGIAYSDANESHSALVAECSVDRASGQITVHHIWAAVDPGVAVQPRNVAVQMEGAIIFGLGAALRDQINVEKGEVQESNFHDYKPLRMSEIPPIDVKVMPSGDAPGGMGEPGVSPVAPAISNAIAALTGKHLRQLPMLPERVKAALA